ncbi:MAG TPA: hypothetical protein H9723_05135 [Candidatus Mediterraneibacter stercoravium]|uniref:DUF3784 domain-containing protein n=1 Tax=Candidatus Mediterraneibacter stercoravium TaxID=2838685 RepID=A0A9D2K1L9_9FIRM|nr:hypothetical protein [Candidatus Mediterraneibacter stercoravium]
MDGIWGIIGIILFFCGLYSFYAYIKMKKSGEINTTLLLGKDYADRKCRNKEAYIKKAGPALLVFGGVSLAAGVIDIVHYYVHRIVIADTAAMIIFIVVIFWFASYTTKLKKEYY